jgi:hypothetical protein
VCPPHAAREVAGSVAGFGGIFVDANAVSPETAREVAGIVGGAGAFVDAGIIGLPPEPGSPGRERGSPGRERGSPGGTRLYVSGDRAAEVRPLFTGTAVDARIVEGGIGAASAVKMAYASWTKGTAALLLAARALARAEGVEDALVAEWALSQPGLAGRTVAAARSAAAKGWRWDAEMTEIAASMAAAGLPDGFHLAAAEIFRRSPRLGPAAPAGSTPDDLVDRVLNALTSLPPVSAPGSRGSGRVFRRYCGKLCPLCRRPRACRRAAGPGRCAALSSAAAARPGTPPAGRCRSGPAASSRVP